MRLHLYDPGQPLPRPDPARVRRLRGMLTLWRRRDATCRCRQRVCGVIGAVNAESMILRAEPTEF